MNIIWLGHASFRIEIADQVLLVDPWFEGNPMFPNGSRDEAIMAATHILVSHAHQDHSSDAVQIAKELDIPIVGIYDLMSWWGEKHGVKTVGFNRGGTVKLGGISVTMVAASHSSSFASENGPIYGGNEAGFMISGDGHVIYFSGDTDVMADMEVFNDLHKPDIGIMSAGGHFTMDMKRAAYAAKRFFDFEVLIPCHYRTFPILEQSAGALVKALPGVQVIEPEVLKAILID